ncbi:uncharacterized protein BDR25DRAFT_111033 [Lindgomyces ingoldianus]|uniref:Uncharacterized protein n=1 Tax=Lindgomyces ingoldianus TaxID=673940 RepID=A0ACB6R6H6_9PLEO|nr:uncharacterized protein BDR25DRAFT_111033 [Lindgomyces ingoldianus]KAF2474677.1 hypothetical protein BDR25DRAFT_111033 [Lindgomyces ingoldianus]
MNGFCCLRIVARSSTVTTQSTLLRPSIRSLRPTQRPPTTTPSPRFLSLLPPRRPLLSLQPFPMPSPATSTTSPCISGDILSLTPKISSHPGLLGMQIRYAIRNTYNPSHFVRKRRHGFLSRLRTRNGRKTLKRRLLKKRSTLSH